MKSAQAEVDNVQNLLYAIDQACLELGCTIEAIELQAGLMINSADEFAEEDIPKLGTVIESVAQRAQGQRKAINKIAMEAVALTKRLRAKPELVLVSNESEAAG